MSPIFAALIFLQAQSAEDTFNKIEESIRAAKCAQVRFVWEGSSKSDLKSKVDATGSILLKEGNRVHLVAKITESEQSSELSVVSDGTTVKTRLGPKRLLECSAPKNLESGLKTALHRLGALQLVLIAHKICMMDPSEQEEALDMGKKPPLSDFQTGPDDGECRTISYKITPEGPESVAEVKLWYTPKTYKLLKRTITIKRPESVFTELYKDWSLDGDLENEEFTLPSVK